MNIRTVLLGSLATMLAQPLIHAANIDRATLTEVVNSVSIIDPASKKTSAAKREQLFLAPNVLRTGSDSRAEMISPDQTVTRVGQSTVFSFEPNSREIDLQRGSILFQSPSGKGGGNIRTPAASAAVLGTTLIVTTTKNGGFKVLLVEGKGRVKSADGTVRILKGGQMVYAMPGGRLSNTLEYRLSQQVNASRLLGGFKKPLPSLGKIQAAINQQEKDIASGKAKSTNLLASDLPNFAIQVDVARQILTEDAFVEVAETPLSQATTTDAIVSAPTLEEGRIFSDGSFNGPGPGANFTSNFGDDDALTVSAAAPASFLANNIIFDTPTVSLLQQTNSDVFQFLAINDIAFNGPVDFGMYLGQELQLIAGGTFTAAPNTLLTADTKQFTLMALGDSFPLDGTLPQSLADVSLATPLELTDFAMRNTGGSVSVIGGKMNLTHVGFESANVTRITAAGDLLLKGLPGAEPSFDPDFIETDPSSNASFVVGAKEARVKSLGNATLEGVALRAPKVRVTSEKILKLTAVQINDGSVATRVPQSEGPTESVGSPGDSNIAGVYLFGKQLADIRKVNFFANDVLVQSKTIRLENVRFRQGSRVLLESALGVLADNPNRNAAVQAGKVNFVQGVQYGSQPAQNAIIQNGPAPTPEGSGIVIRPFKGRPAN